jgi:hypothetical protein
MSPTNAVHSAKPDQVIEEYAPARMPKDPRKNLDACIRWFALWTQRVMPNALWQQAMQQAMKRSDERQTPRRQTR